MKSRFIALALGFVALVLTAAYNPKPLAIASGGTAASTAAGARDSVLWGSAATVACSSPCTPGTGITTVTVAGTTTVNLPAITSYADGQRLLIVCDSAASCPVTLDPSDTATCDGGSAGAACAEITVLAHGVVGAIRTSATTWGSVQPGGLAPNGFRWYIEGGAVYARATHIAGGVTVDVGAPVAATAADPTSFGATVSGANIVVPSGAVGIATALGANGQRWGWQVSDLGVTVPATAFQANVKFELDSVTGTRGGAPIDILAGFGTSATAPQRCHGTYIATTGTSIGYSYLTAAGGGLPTNAGGATTMTGAVNSQWYGGTGTTNYWMARLDSGVQAAFSTAFTGPAVTTLPTHFTLYVYVEPGILTNTLTVTNPRGSVWW